MLSLEISTSPGAASVVVVTDAYEFYVNDLVRLLEALAESRVDADKEVR